jgi:hypothetical protein
MIMAAESRELMIVEENSYEISPADARRQLQAIREFQAVVKSEMVEGQDYGVIPGTEKPTLYKPGAEKLAKLMRCSDLYEILDQKEDWESGFFYYMVKCKLVLNPGGVTISEGIASANSKENQWRWRWAWPNEVPAGVDKSKLQVRKGTSKKGKPYTMYRVENDDPYSLVNTIQKMASKRALVAAALSAGRLSNIFTQDMEDIAGAGDEGAKPGKAQGKQAKPAGVRMIADKQKADIETIALSVPFSSGH